MRQFKYFLIGFYSLFYFNMALADVSERERAALVEFYNKLEGENWLKNDNWLVGDPCENNWQGVRCEDEEITHLDLKDNNMAGFFSETMGDLIHLKDLDLERNHILGTLPMRFFELVKLEQLDLSHNQLNGEINNAIDRFTLLESIDLSNNNFSGAIPVSIGSLPRLTELNLRRNQLSSKIPKQIGNLPLLKELDLRENQLSGEIPATLANLSRLTHLNLSVNQLEGSIPASFNQIPLLTELILNDNQLTGALPENFISFNQFWEINLSSNQLIGVIPENWGNLKELRALNLTNNQLTGSIPSSFGNLINLHTLELSNNQLTGSIPNELGNAVELTRLYINNNQLTGEIPLSLGNTQLANTGDVFFEDGDAVKAEFSLEKNQISGTIPPALSHLISPEDLQLTDNPNQSNSITQTPEPNQPLILIVAGIDEANPALTVAVNELTNFAFRALRNKNIPPKNILYLNDQIEQNPDQNGGNDVYAAPNKELIKDAITQWAKTKISEGQPFILYFAGHGLKDSFQYRLSTTTISESINALELDGWLDQFQLQNPTNPVIVIYDACFSASFIAPLQATAGQQRVNIFSAEADKLAYFGALGNTSFSFMFWANTQKGQDLNTTFKQTVAAMRSISSNRQKPQMDDNGNGLFEPKIEGGLAATLSIGQSGITGAALPIITDITLPTKIIDTDQVNIVVGVNQPNIIIDQVWAIVISPTLARNNDALTELPRTNLVYNAQTQKYQGQIKGLTQNGSYQIMAFASLNNGSGFVSIPVDRSLTVIQNNIPQASLQQGAEVRVFLPNVSFLNQNYQAALRFIESPDPLEFRFELVQETLNLINETNFISAVVEQESLDIEVPSIIVGTQNFHAFLEFMPEQLPALKWRLYLPDLIENQ